MNSSFFHHEEGHDMDQTEDVTCSMNMSLHWGACEFILWKTWQANTVAKFVMACIGFFLLAFLYEALKYYREEMFIRAQTARNAVVKNDNGESLTRSGATLSVREQMFNAPHIYQSVLHVLQVFTSYILMLIVMLCNLWLIIAICLGAAFGYFTFGWMRKITHRDTSECCY